MPNLVFVRHSQTQPDSEIPSRLWLLTEEGRRRCQLLSELLISYHLDVIVTSYEPKAIETGELAARRLGISCQVMDDLHEHERQTTPYFETREEFLEAVNNLFSRPDELVFGNETALQARERFNRAVASVLAAYPRENIAIVTHGTVLSLFAIQFIDQEIFPFWQGLGLPAIVAFSYPEMGLLAQVNEIA